VYSRYADSHWSEPINPDGQTLGEQLWSLAPMKHNKETFVNEIKCVKEFSEKWGLKIEERELSLEERCGIQINRNDYQSYYTKDELDKNNIPTKLITVNYKNEKIEVYG
jgi:hypothetical protein